MLLSLKRHRDEAAAPGVVDLLLGCHARIRHFTSVASALAGAAGAPPGEIQAAAGAVVRYFVEALPLHSADEDGSLAPRLLALPLTEAERHAVEAMTREHPGIHDRLSRLLPLWRAVEADPERLAVEAAPLQRLTAELATAWDAHLGPEEALVFPALNRLSTAEDLAAIQNEMRARRGP